MILPSLTKMKLAEEKPNVRKDFQQCIAFLEIGIGYRDG